MKKALHYTFLLIAAGIFTTCQKEPISLSEAIELGELSDKNYAQLKQDVVLVEDADIHIQLDSTGLTLAGSMDQYEDSLKVGAVMAKLTYKGGDDFTYFRRITSIKEEGGNTRIETEHVGFPEVFERINFSTARRGEGVVIFRNDIYNYGYTVKPAMPFVIQEIKGTLSPDYEYTFSMDSSQSVITIQYDNVLGIVPRIDIALVDVQLGLVASSCLSGQVSGGYKNDKIIPTNFPTPIFAFPMLGMGIYFNPKIEALVKLKGTVCLPELGFTTTPFPLNGTIHPLAPILLPNFGTGLPVVSPVVGNFTVGGEGSFEVFVGGDLYASNLGPRNTHLIKAGMAIGGYGRIVAKAKGELHTLVAETDVKADFGLAGKIFASAEMFNTTAFNNAVKVGAYWETSTIRFPVYEIEEIFPANCDKDITNITLEPSSGNLNFRVDCTNCAGSKYFVSYNDSTLLNGNGTVREFDYNQDYSLAAGLFLLLNRVTFQDKVNQGCFFYGEFADPTFGHDNCTTFTDPRDDNVYCMDVIGGQTWLRDNIRHDAAGGVWYNHEENLENVFFGRLYTYDEVLAGQEANAPGGNSVVQGICPPGFHLPTKEEFDELITYLGGEGQAGKKMKYPGPSFWPNANLPNVGTFFAVPAGEYYPWLESADPFGKKYNEVTFWTSSTTLQPDGQTSVPVVLKIGNNDGLNIGGGYKHTIERIGYSCRCIKD